MHSPGPTAGMAVEAVRVTASLPSDEELLARFVRGDRESFGKLAQRHEPSLLGLARAMLAGRDDLARDAVQEAWLRAIRHARGFDGRNGASVRTWLYRIVVNRCHDMRARAERSGVAVPVEEVGHDEAGCSKTGGKALDGERRARLRCLLEDLPEGARVVVLLCYHHDLTHPQVAAILNLPLGTVKSRLNAALNTLRDRVGEEWR